MDFSFPCPIFPAAGTLSRVNNLTDQQLLRAYAEQRSESAFAELVRRRVDLVYSAALRMVRDTHLAQDVTQGAFLALAQNASQLADHPVLSGWLHRTAQNLAVKVVRTDVRRRAREQEAATMNELLAGAPDAPWEQIAPHLDAALGELGESDRDALLLRYFERKTAQEIAQTLGISDEAAQKRVNRAVDRLREHLAKRGLAAGAAGLAAVIAANAVQAAPAGLAASITAVATALTAATFATAATTTASGTVTLIKMKIIAAILVAAVAAGTATHFVRQRQTSLQTVQNPVLAATAAAPPVARNGAVGESTPPANDPQPLQNPSPIPSDAAALQGTWTGPEIGSASQSKAVLTITGSNLDFRGADTNEWYTATFVLHENVNPKQLIAVVTACPAPPYVGKTANAIYQFEGGSFRLSGNEPGDPTMPASFTNAPGARQFLFQRTKP